MLNFGKFIYVITLMLAFSGVSLADDYNIQAGRTIDVVLTTPVNTSTSTLNGYVEALADQPFYDDGNYILPAGTKLEGGISFIDKINAAVKLNFQTILMPDGQKIPISAMIETKDETGILKKKTNSKVSSFKKIFIGAGKKAAISAATTTAIKAVTSDAVYTSLKMVGTARDGVGIAKDIKDKEYKKAGIGTAEQVVKYSPYGTAYKYGKSALKGYKSYNNQEKQGQEASKVLVLEKGMKLEVIFLQPFTVSR